MLTPRPRNAFESSLIISASPPLRATRLTPASCWCKAAIAASFALPSPRSRNVGTLAGTGSGCGSGSGVSSTDGGASTTGGFGLTGACVAVGGGTTAADDVVTGAIVVVVAAVAVSTITEAGGVTSTDVCDGFAVMGAVVVVLAVVAVVVPPNELRNFMNAKTPAAPIAPRKRSTTMLMVMIVPVLLRGAAGIGSTTVGGASAAGDTGGGAGRAGTVAWRTTDGAGGVDVMIVG